MLHLLLVLQLQIPAPTGYVNDFAGVLDASSRTQIQAIVDEVKQKSGGEIVLVTLNDLAGRTSIDLARDIGREWKVGAMGGPGDRARNAGVILLFKPGRRPGDGQADIAIATGTGTEGFITDARAGRIRDAIGRESVQSGSYATGLVTGVALLAQAYATEFGFALSGGATQTAPRAGQRFDFSAWPFFIVVLFIIVAMRAFAGRRRRGGLLQALLDRKSVV